MAKGILLWCEAASPAPPQHPGEAVDLHLSEPQAPTLTHQLTALLFSVQVLAGTSHCWRSAMVCQLHMWRRPISVNILWTNLPGSYLQELPCTPGQANTRFRCRTAQMFSIVHCFFTGSGRHTRLCFIRPLIDASDC